MVQTTDKVVKSFLLLMVSGCLSLAGCSKKGGSTPAPTPPPPPPGPVWNPNAMRGVWLTTTASTALDSRDNIRQAVLLCKQSGINNIFMVVYNNGRTMFPSTTMNNVIGVPILEKFNGRDPLQELIEEADKEKIKVHAWFEYGFASSFSANGGPIIAAKPHWASRDINGSITSKNGFEWLNPFHPEVQNFILSLVKEVATKYNVAGIQGDDRLPALPTTGGYDAFTVDLYKSENNGTEPPTVFSNANWIEWRVRKLNQFLKKMYTEVKAIKPGLQVTLSPSVFPWGKTEYLQDWPSWVDSGWVDAIIPQVYRYDLPAYNSTLAQQKSYFKSGVVKFYPGVLLRVGSYVASAEYLSQMVSNNRMQGFDGEVFFFFEGLKERTTWFQSTYPQIK
jgi:uncharacterized lipoprotein YddW (UPF0748 family)